MKSPEEIAEEIMLAHYNEDGLRIDKTEARIVEIIQAERTRADERDEMILKMREIVTRIQASVESGGANKELTDATVLCSDVLRLNIPASTQRLEDMEKVVEAARKIVPGLISQPADVATLKKLLESEPNKEVYINPDGSVTASPEMEALRKALTALDNCDKEGRA